MQVSKSFIQAMGILVMLAEQPKDIPLKSIIISQRMSASHTYLLKIANKLKKAGIIDAIASKKGGYYLGKKPSEVSYLDVYNAIEKEPLVDTRQSKVGSMFKHQDLVQQGKEQFLATFAQAEKSFKGELAQHTLSELIPRDKSGNYLEIDWSKE